MRTRVNYDVREQDGQTISFDADETTGSFTFTHQGFVVAAIVALPNFTNDVTGTLAITDPNGNELASQSAMAKNGTSVRHFDLGYCPCVGEMTVSLTLSGVPGGSGGDATVTLITT